MENRRIRPYHYFEHRDRHYFVNIEKMSARAIDDDCVRTLARLKADPATPLASRMEEQLEQLGLLAAVDPAINDAGKAALAPVVNVALFLTQSCNLKCVYCYGDGGGYGTGGKMTESTAFQAVDWLIEQSGRMKMIHVGFFGGEPFLNFPLLRAVVAYARKRVGETGKEVGFHATTNGTRLDDETVSFIKKHGIRITVSLDGPREVHDAQRPFANGKGSYNIIVAGLKKLLAVMPDTNGHAVLSGNADPQAVKSALKEIGFSTVTFAPASVSLFAGVTGTPPPKRDFTAMMVQLDQEAETWLSLIKNRNGGELQALKSKSQLALALLALLHNSKRRHACGAGVGMVGVSCAGDVYLCHRFVGREEYKLGSVFSRDLDREKYGRSPVTFVEVCAACCARYYCAGGCKHDNAGSCGSAFAPSEDVCRVRRRELELAAVISGGLQPADRAFLAEHDIVPPKPCPLDF